MPLPEEMVRLIPISGLLLVLFLLAHLLGMVLALVDPAAFEAYATSLHHQLWLVPVEVILAVVAVVHLSLTLWRSLANARARGPGGYVLLRSRRGEPLAALAARTAPWSGVVLMVFLSVHLAQLRWPRPASGHELAALGSVLASPWSLTLYALAGLAAGLHLLHGGESAHRSLGWLDEANARRIRDATRLLAMLLGGGFALLPLALVATAGRGSP
jgi:succinate dehydrogenase / fumarate reductase cytochrome b subunit